jgi:uncharacterized protein YodC (DUF2158 family)
MRKGINNNLRNIIMNVFKVGDIVVLKSGGPKMTIIEIFNKGSVFKTYWFIEGILKCGEFIGDVLVFYEEKDYNAPNLIRSVK